MAQMIVSLPMYDLPELAAATADWWRGLRRHMTTAGIEGLPAELTRPGDPHAHWLEPDLIFSQTCGYPLTHELKGKVRLLATPHYAAAGCEGATYVSQTVVRADDPATSIADLKGRRAAYNDRQSQSGYNVLRHLVAPFANGKPFFGAALESGAHRRSLAMVRDGAADVATIDCVSLALIGQVAPNEVRGIRVLCQTARAPSLPYITALETSPEQLARLRQGLSTACADPALAATRTELLIAGCEVLPLASYDEILVIERAAQATDYPELV
jgi:ABC-type phosphate/phosphonate transport system substrate-binding protein